MRLALAFLLLVTSPLSAQTDDHAHQHSLAASQIGAVRFPSSCAPAAASNVQTAVALLHSFWYDEAEKTFRRAISEDGRCAIAYWGVAMTQYYPLWPVQVTPERMRIGSEALAAARALKDVPSRERAYVDALSIFYDQPAGTSVHERALKYETAMASLTARFPDDDEAAIFYALALNGSALPTDKTHAKQKAAAKILNGLLAKYPHHPGIIHYLIHSDDSPELAPLALDAARSYAKIAPSVPHALHMPSHIFTRLGLWEESIASNLASAKSAKEHSEVDEQLHAMDYLEYAYLQLGRFDEARSVADDLRAMQRLQQIDTKTTYAVAAIPARYALERHDWRAAAALTPAGGIDWDANPRTAMLTQFAIAIGAARSGDIDRAKGAEAALTRYAASVSADPLWSSMVTVARKSATAWRLFAEGQKEEALVAMRAAADQEDLAEKPAVTPGSLLPARELLGDMLLEMKRPKDALSEYKAVLDVSPKRRNALIGAEKASAALDAASR